MTAAITATGVQHYRKIFATWWPLAASWILMSLELPALSAVIARLPNPDINLAAYGGVVFPLALIFESPIIMLLAASTALSKDYASYKLLRTYTIRAGLILTAVHIADHLYPAVLCRGSRDHRRAAGDRRTGAPGFDDHDPLVLVDRLPAV